MKKLLILGAGIMQVPIIKKSKKMGYYTIVADYDEKAPGMQFADKTYLVSTNDKDGILEVSKNENIDGILTTSDSPVNVVAYVSRVLGLHGMSEEVARICTNKYLQREVMLKNGIKTPYFKLCSNDENLSVYTDFPYIVKPCDSSASRGVKKVSNASELSDAFKDALSYSRSGKVLIEGFITGREFSVETLTQNHKTTIVNITEKFTKGEEEGYFVEDTHLEPARLTKKERELIEHEVMATLHAIGFNNCPSHTEVKLNSKGAFIIETACRLGGDYITSDLVPLSTGIDMLENLILLALGEPINVQKTLNKISMVQFLDQENYYNCLSFIERNKGRIARYEVEPKHNRPIKSSLDRMGYIIMQLDNYDEFNDIKKEI